MRIKVEWEFDLPSGSTEEDHDRFAIDNGVPLTVNLNEYFDDPESVGIFTITDALSDEHGWLVQDWYCIEEEE